MSDIARMSFREENQISYPLFPPGSRSFPCENTARLSAGGWNLPLLLLSPSPSLSSPVDRLQIEGSFYEPGDFLLLAELGSRAGVDAPFRSVLVLAASHSCSHTNRLWHWSSNQHAGGCDVTGQLVLSWFIWVGGGQYLCYTAWTPLGPPPLQALQTP